MYHTKSTDKELVATKSLHHVTEVTIKNTVTVAIENTVTVAKQEMTIQNRRVRDTRLYSKMTRVINGIK